MGHGGTAGKRREPRWGAGRIPGMASDDENKEVESPRDRRTTAMLLTAVVVGGGFATIALLKGAFDLLRRYGGL